MVLKKSTTLFKKMFLSNLYFNLYIQIMDFFFIFKMDFFSLQLNLYIKIKCSNKFYGNLFEFLECDVLTLLCLSNAICSRKINLKWVFNHYLVHRSIKYIITWKLIVVFQHVINITYHGNNKFHHFGMAWTNNLVLLDC